jgi:hypothetical protein
MQLSDKYVSLVEKLHNQTEMDRVFENYRNNLVQLRDDITTIQNALEKLINSGEITKVEGEAYYDGSGFEFYGDMRLGHHFYIRITPDRKNWIDLSVKTKHGERSISWEEDDMTYMIAALESVNYLRATFASGKEIFDLYINPFTSNVENSPRENE